MIRKLVKAGTWRGGAWGTRLFGGLLALALLPSFAGAQTIEDKIRAQRESRSLFNLASSATVVLNVNQFQCGLMSAGDTCTDVFNSPTGGGGFWPAGSPNQYMFNSGLQVAGIIPLAADCTNKATSNTPTCFPWSGDTTGAFFMDAAGTNKHGTPITEIYNSLDAQDLANWPVAGSVPDFPTLDAFVRDTSLFNPVLIGREAASQQDTWVAYWDGDPNKTGGRQHPMGIIVEQRTMAWNYPEGNENVIYFIYKFTNATNNQVFQRVNEARYFGGANALPDAGWRFDSLYVAFDSDPDVGSSPGNNYATGIMPFNMGISYVGPMYDDAFDYPPNIFRAPFFQRAPGIVGMKYLRSPIDPATGEEVGLTSLSQHTNGGRFPDPSTVQRGWRYISLNVDPGKGDPACSFEAAEVRALRSCFLNQSQSDVRVFIGSGPFSLGPGETATIAVAMFAAATVNTPLITSAPSADNKPGIPSLAPGCFGNPIRPIEVASGWVRTNTCPESSFDVLDQFEVDVVPGSLLGRALVAQAIFDNNFLLGFAPEPPPFYLVPGDNQVTVLWEQSQTEVVRPNGGDPFFSAAGDPENTLYDPNYRQYDVEGYRIYRGTSPANMQLIAQFDKTGSTFTDVLCVTPFEDPDTHLEAPPPVTGEPCTAVREYEIRSPFVQFRSVTRLQTGAPFLIEADTALVTEIRAGRALPLEDTGIPFAYIDTDVRNGFQYFYRVTAFDINSARSGPSSLESASPAKPTVPVKTSPNVTLASFQSSLMGGDKVLNPNAPLPTIHPQHGTFSGPMPPTNSITAAFAPLVERLLPEFSLTIQIDSVKVVTGAANCPNGFAPQFAYCWNMFLTIDKDGQKTQVVQNGFTPVWSAFGGPGSTTYTLASVPVAADPTSAAAFGVGSGFTGFNAGVEASFYENIWYSNHSGQANQRMGSGSGTVALPNNLTPTGSRWFSGPNETTPDPARFQRVGRLEGVDTIVSPTHNTRLNEANSPVTAVSNCFPYSAAAMGRAADTEVRWSGAKPVVFDVTHNVPVPFMNWAGASYGFLTQDMNGNGFIDWADFQYIGGVAGALCPAQANLATLTDTPTLVGVSTGSVAVSALTQTGMGFGLYLNGERFIFQLSALPTGNTVWTVRQYAGIVSASAATALTNDPTGYTFTPAPRPPMVPGLKVTFVTEAATSIAAGAVNLKAIHTVPDPYYAVSQFDLSPGTKELQFVNLPPRATIRIYSMSGVLVDIINHDAPEGGSMAKWNLRNRSNQFVASGVYFYHVTTPDGKEHAGKFTVINAGFSR